MASRRLRNKPAEWLCFLVPGNSTFFRHSRAGGNPENKQHALDFACACVAQTHPRLGASGTRGLETITSQEKTLHLMSDTWPISCQCHAASTHYLLSLRDTDAGASVLPNRLHCEFVAVVLDKLCQFAKDCVQAA